MFTALQFSQLAAAAWSGPAAGHVAAISYNVTPCGHAVARFSISYHLGGACYLQLSPCPFAAIATAVAQAAAAGVPVCRRHARAALARAAAALCGVRALARPGFACRARARRVARFSHV